MIKKIQETIRTYIQLRETGNFGVSAARVSGSAEAVSDAIAGIQQVEVTGQYKLVVRARPKMPDTSWITQPPGISTNPFTNKSMSTATAGLVGAPMPEKAVTSFGLFEVAQPREDVFV